MKLFYLQEFNHLLHHSCSDGLLNNFQRGRKGAAENASSSLSEAERKRGEGQEKGRALWGANYCIQNKQATGLRCTLQGTQPIFYHNYKWNTTFKNCESLCHTPETYVKLYTN